MSIQSSILGGRGTVAVRKLNAVERAPLGWTLRNRLTWRFLSGWLAYWLAKAFSWFTGVVIGTRIVTLVAETAVRKRTFDNDIERQHFLSLWRAGRYDEAEAYAAGRARWIDYGVVSYRVITDAAVAYLVDDMDDASGSADVSLFNYHGVGTGTGAEAVGDTALGTESTTILNPDSTRATGTRAQPAANQYRTTGTVTFDGSGAITEHGLFSQAATGGGTLWDRSVFSAINVVSADTLQTQYTLTVTSGS